jgi:hypothetical protein
MARFELGCDQTVWSLTKPPTLVSCPLPTGNEEHPIPAPFTCSSTDDQTTSERSPPPLGLLIGLGIGIIAPLNRAMSRLTITGFGSRRTCHLILAARSEPS